MNDCLDYMDSNSNFATNGFSRSDGKSSEDLVTMVDPMNLLEIVDHPDYVEEHLSDFESIIEEGDEHRTQLLNEKWEKWMHDHPWLLHEVDDGYFVYCIYCDSKLSVKRLHHILQHEASINHKEKEDNYLAFKKFQEEACESSPITSIKLEFGTSSSISAIKLNRMSQTDLLNNFNWRRWMQTHEWLIRDEPDGNNGFCKYCKVRLNAEFSYLRVRHEEKAGHKDAKKLYKQKLEGREIKRKSNHKESKNNEKEHVNSSVESDKSDNVLDDESKNRGKLGFNYYKETSNGCCCILCGIEMSKTSFRRHQKSKMHSYNLQQRCAKSNSLLVKEEKPDWLVTDPNNSAYSYCKYCKKRLLYGRSVSKQKMHENSIGHILAVKEYKIQKEVFSDSKGLPPKVPLLMNLIVKKRKKNVQSMKKRKIGVHKNVELLKKKV